MNFNKSCLLTGIFTAIINLALHSATFLLFLKNFYSAHPAGSEAYLKQLNRSPDALVIWALLLSAFAFGFFITTMMSWSGAKSFSDGLKHGVFIGLLFWTSINFGLYAAQNIFSLPAVIADLFCSTFAMAVSSGFSAWCLSKLNIKTVSSISV